MSPWLPVLAQTRPFPDWEWIQRNGDTVLEQGIEHVTLTVMAVTIGFVIAFPLAVLVSRRRAFQTPVLQVTGILFTIPSLALFVGLVPLTGLSTTTALIPLTLYTLLILVRNTLAGLDSVPKDVVEAARAMGYREWTLLRSVELPLALPVIIAGVRIATVTTIGLVVVTAVIGQGGWGQMMYTDGFQRQNLTPTLLGFVLSVALAVILDLLLVAVEHRLSPWARAS